MPNCQWSLPPRSSRFATTKRPGPQPGFALCIAGTFKHVRIQRADAAVVSTGSGNIERGLDHTASDFMTRDPKTIAPDALVDDALGLFEEYKITAVFVVEDGSRRPVGVIHIHDCPAAR